MSKSKRRREAICSAMWLRRRLRRNIGVRRRRGGVVTRRRHTHVEKPTKWRSSTRRSRRQEASARRFARSHRRPATRSKAHVDQTKKDDRRGKKTRGPRRRRDLGRGAVEGSDLRDSDPGAVQ